MKTATIEARDWADRNSGKLVSYIRRLLKDGNDKVLVYDCGQLLFAAYAGDRGQLADSGADAGTVAYKGYVGTVKPIGQGRWHASGSFGGDSITARAESLESLGDEWEISVEEYLKFCREKGREPKKP